MTQSKLTTAVRGLLRLISTRGGTDLTDQQLLDRFVRERDEAAFAAIVGRHGSMVWGVCQRVLGNSHDAEDTFQATFLVLVRKAASIGRPERLGNWLYGVAHRTALKARSMARRAVGVSRPSTQMALHDIPAKDSSTDETWRDLQPILDEELVRLPERYRLPMVLHYLEGKSKDETAKVLGWPEGTVSGRLARGREMLRRRFMRRGIALSGGVFGAAIAQSATQASVPVPLIASTAQAAGMVAAGDKITAEIVFTQAMALSDGVIKTMFIAKLKLTGALIVTIGLLGTGVGLVRYATGSRDIQEWKEQITLPGTSPLIFSADGKSLTTGSSDGTLKVWDVSSGKQVAEKKPIQFDGYQPLGLRDSKLLVAAKVEVVGEGEAKETRLTTDPIIFERETGKQQGTLRGHAKVISASGMSPDGKTIVTAGGKNWDTANEVKVWDMEIGKQLALLIGHTGTVARVSFSPDGRMLATVGALERNGPITPDAKPGELKIWSTQNWQEQTTLAPHPRPVLNVAWSPDSKTVASASFDFGDGLYSRFIRWWNPGSGGWPEGRVKLWDVATGKVRREIVAGQFLVNSLLFSPDGTTLVTGGADETARIWDSSTGNRLAVLRGHKGRVGRLAFSPDGKYLATGSVEARVRFAKQEPAKAEVKLWRLVETNAR